MRPLKSKAHMGRNATQLAVFRGTKTRKYSTRILISGACGHSKSRYSLIYTPFSPGLRIETTRLVWAGGVIPGQFFLCRPGKIIAGCRLGVSLSVVGADLLPGHIAPGTSIPIECAPVLAGVSAFMPV